MTEILEIELDIFKHNVINYDINPLNNSFVDCIMKHFYSLVDVIHKLDLIKL